MEGVTIFKVHLNLCVYIYIYIYISHTAWEVKKRRMGVYLAYKPTHSTAGQYIAESGVLYMISG